MTKDYELTIPSLVFSYLSATNKYRASWSDINNYRIYLCNYIKNTNSVDVISYLDDKNIMDFSNSFKEYVYCGGRGLSLTDLGKQHLQTTLVKNIDSSMAKSISTAIKLYLDPDLTK